MDTYRIAEVVEKTGIPATALRYYDEIGLAPAPLRSDAGYRLYDERSLERLRFIARAKELGLGLEEVKTLAELWDGGECGPVQQEMARLVDTKIFAIEQRTRELVALANQLGAIASRLHGEPHPGACNDTCACVAGSHRDDPTIACTLTSADDVAQRVHDWRALAAKATSRERVDGGLRLRFPSGADVAGDLARLAAMEVGCCGWIDFSVGVSAEGTTLEVRAPEAGTDIITSMFGRPS